MNKDEAEAAYNAGRNLVNVEWPEDVTDEHKKLGMHHSPFAKDDPRNSEYARGLQDAIEANTPPDLPGLTKEIDDAVKMGEQRRA